MKTYLKGLWIGTLACVLGMAATSDAAAHRGGDDPRAGARSGRICGAQGMRQAMPGIAARAVDPAFQAVRDLVALECLYRREGKIEKIEPLYRDALAKSAQPMVRSIAYRRLARMAWRRGEHGVAEDMLKQSLQENLK